MPPARSFLPQRPGAARLPGPAAAPLAAQTAVVRFYKGRPVTGFTLVAATELLPPGPPGRPKPDSPGLLHLLVRAQQLYRSRPGRRHRSGRHLPAPHRGPPDPPAAPGARADRPSGRRTARRAGRLRRAARRPPHRGPPGAAAAARAARGAPLRPRFYQGDIPAGLLYPGPRRRAVQLLPRLRRTADPQALPPGRPRRQPGPGAAPGTGHAAAPPGSPAPLAWLEADGGAEPLVLGVLQPFLRGCDDGWELALGALARGRTSPARPARWAGPPPRCTRRWPKRCPP